MPRVNVSDEELAVLEKWRFKNATDLGFNQGLKEASDMVRSIMSGYQESADARKAVTEMLDAIAGLRREIKF